MSIPVGLRGMLSLIRVDTLRRVHTVGFLAGRLIYKFTSLTKLRGQSGHLEINNNNTCNNNDKHNISNNDNNNNNNNTLF